MSSGYSKTPLIKKLGIKPGQVLRFVHAPPNYQALLGNLPTDVRLITSFSESADFVHLFSKEVASFEQDLQLLKDQIKKDGMIWVSWYKKSSKIPTDMSEDIIRQTAISLGLVDVKVCAVDEQWSGLKLVWRLENR